MSPDPHQPMSFSDPDRASRIRFGADQIREFGSSPIASYFPGRPASLAEVAASTVSSGGRRAAGIQEMDLGEAAAESPRGSTMSYPDPPPAALSRPERSFYPAAQEQPRQLYPLPPQQAHHRQPVQQPQQHQPAYSAPQPPPGAGAVHNPPPGFGGYAPFTSWGPGAPQQEQHRTVADRRRASDDTLYSSNGVHPDPSAPPPLKPALRRSSTEEHLRRLAAQQAETIVERHAARAEGRVEAEQHVAPRRGSGRQGMDEDELEKDAEGERRRTGVLGNLLKIYGKPPAHARTHSAETATSFGSSRATSMDSNHFPGRPSAPRTGSANSIATTLNDYVIDEYDPRVAAQQKADKKNQEQEKKRPGLAGRWSFSDAGGDDGESVKTRRSLRQRRRSSVLDEGMDLDGAATEKSGKKKKPKKPRRLSVAATVADIIQRQGFILKLAKALMTFGAPSHRLEAQLNATARVLDVDAQFIHIPSVVIASFGDIDTHTSETHFVKAAGGLNLGQLHRVHSIYKAVVHDEVGVEEGSLALTRILRAKPIYNLWQRMIIASLCAGIIAPLGFGGSLVDALVSGGLGAMLAFLQLHAARKNAIYSNIFEISIATIISFIARALSTTNYFCYEAISSAGVVLVLPGYIILCGSLELASKNLVAGSVRMVYAIIYTLFLGFSITIGSDIYFLFDPHARARLHEASATMTTVAGNLTSSTPGFDFSGMFTFVNETQTSVTSTAKSLSQGNVMCYREEHWEWWRSDISVWWLFLLVPAFSLFLSMWNLQPIRSRELPVMIFISCIGYATNKLANTYIFNRSDVVSFIGATVIGLLGNMYSRVFGGTSFTSMATGVLFLVPSGIAAAGGLAMSNSGDSYNTGLSIGFRMVSVSIGVTTGLFFASFCVYSIGSKRKGGGLGFTF